MRKLRTHKDLLAWQEAVALAEGVYRCTAQFPKEEAYVLTPQLRRCAISVPSNIAEGAGRASPKELVQFLNVASGSLAELETQIELAIRLGYLSRGEPLVAQLTRVSRLLTGLRKSLRNAPVRVTSNQ